MTRTEDAALERNLIVKVFALETAPRIASVRRARAGRDRAL
jgi:hypothetical protein